MIQIAAFTMHSDCCKLENRFIIVNNGDFTFLDYWGKILLQIIKHFLRNLFKCLPYAVEYLETFSSENKL